MRFLRLVPKFLASLCLAAPLAAATDECFTITFGKPCPAVLKPNLSDSNTKATITVTGAPANAYGCLEIDTKKTEFKLPSSNCLFNVLPIITLSLVANAKGEASASFTLPKIQGCIYMQLAFVDKDRLVATNAVGFCCCKDT